MFSGALLDQVIEARRDPGKLKQIVAQNQDAIRSQFADWRQVPEEIRQDGPRIQAYGEALMGIARIFAEGGDPTLLNSLQGGGGTPQEKAALQARELMAKFHYQDALQLLAPVVDANPEPTEVRAVLLGLAGEALFFGGGNPESVERTLGEAFEICRRLGSQEGQIAYLSSLYEADRYHGYTTKAMQCLKHLATLWQSRDPMQSRICRRQAEVISAGEPLNRIVVRIGQHELEIDDLPMPLPNEAKLDFIFRRNRISMRPCQAMCDMGKHLGRQADYGQALKAFDAAAGSDPYDPDPHYQKGYTLLLTGRYAEAAEAFDVTEQLAPGWYNCRSDGWTARALAAGHMTLDLYQQINQLEEGSGDKVRLAQALQPQASDWGLFWLHYGKALQQRNQVDKAREAWLQGLVARHEDEVKTRLLASLATVTESAAERLRLAQEAVALNGHLVSAAGARILIRQESK
ncbi:MAG TPA: tetratricopeptide repeat protein [Candidatus Xenobia bacterium]|jgi:tetratricopeptide (TPR) repeat protein